MKYEYSFLIRILIVVVSYPLLTFLLTLPTLYGVFILTNFLHPILQGQSIIVNTISYDIIKACVAPLAYWILIILIFLTKEISLKKRVYMLLIGLISLYLINITRIAFLIYIGSEISLLLFDKLHLLIWHFISGVSIIIVWIFLIKYFKIKSIPFYDDLHYLYRKSFLKNVFSSSISGKLRK